jgi:hypothetical protein
MRLSRGQTYREHNPNDPHTQAAAKRDPEAPFREGCGTYSHRQVWSDGLDAPQEDAGIEAVRSRGCPAEPAIVRLLTLPPHGSTSFLMKHTGIASNTRDCFSTFIGCKVVGVLFNVLPINDREMAEGTKTLVFDDSHGLTIALNGSFWTESQDSISGAIECKKKELARAQDELRGILQLAGALPETRP